METSKFALILIFIFLFYLISIIAINWVVIFKGLKRVNLDYDEIKINLPLLLASNLGVMISAIVLIKPFLNFITFQTSLSESAFYLFSNCTIIFVINIVFSAFSYILSKLITKTIMKAPHILILSVIWLTINTLLILLTNEFYIQISSTNAFTIY